ncbi:hypothetical protein GF415_04100 [Candidatus Micrarchaeota archaeon]|nr:hypothetical protein [Candidatus Micrarchaeota archaeon]
MGSRLTIRKPKNKGKMGETPVKTQEKQADRLLYLISNMMDAKLDRGFSGGIMLSKGGGASDFAMRLGLGLVEGDTTDSRAAEVLLSHTKEEKQNTFVMRKMRKLFRRLSQGKNTHRPGRYISFSTPAKAKAAMKLLGKYGFETRQKKPGTKGFEITALPKDIEKAIARLEKDLVGEAKTTYIENAESARAAENRKRKKVTDELFVDLARIKSEARTARKAKEEGAKEFRVERESYAENVKQIDPGRGADIIMDYDDRKASPSYAETRLVKELLKRKEVRESLMDRWPFYLMNKHEFTEYVKALRGRSAGKARTRPSGAELRQLRAGREPVPAWKPIMENVHRLEEGKKATFIRHSYETAAATRAELEARYPKRSITWTHTPEMVGGKDQGEWKILVHPEGEKAETPRAWLRKTFSWSSGRSKLDSALAKVLETYGEERISVRSKPGTYRDLPPWFRDIAAGREENYRVKERISRALLRKGLTLEISSRPVRERGTGDIEEYVYTVTVSGRKMGRHLLAARKAARERRLPKLKKVSFEGPAPKRRDNRPLSARVAEKMEDASRKRHLAKQEEAETEEEA